jgi:hypothetical protein
MFCSIDVASVLQQFTSIETEVHCLVLLTNCVFNKIDIHKTTKYNVGIISSSLPMSSSISVQIFICKFLWIIFFDHFSRSVALSSRSLSTQSSVDPTEINRFRQLSSSWWNETGEYAALHSLNQLRIPFIREQLLQSSSKPNDSLKPLKGFQLLDIGCGGGILTEVCWCIIITKFIFLFASR